MLAQALALAAPAGLLNPYGGSEFANALVMDFTRGIYQQNGQPYGGPENLPGWSYTRSGEDLLTQMTDGSWRAYPANNPGVTGAGLPVYEATTNKCANWNFTSTSTSGMGTNNTTLTKVARADLPAPVLAALEAVDPRGIVTHAFRCVGDGSVAGQSCSVNAQAGTLNPHTVSVYAYIVSGAPVLDLGQASLGTTPLLTNFTRTTFTATPDVTSRNLRMRQPTAAASEWYFFGTQLEEKAYATPPVIVSGASASRGAAVPLITGLTSLFSGSFTLEWAANKDALTDGTNRRILTVDNGTAGQGAIRLDTTNRIQSSIDSVGGQSLASAPLNGTMNIYGWMSFDGTTLRHSVNGSAVQSVLSAAPVTADRIYPGCTRTGVGQLNAPLRMAAVYTSARLV
ncbi:hypothetical protein [Caulobacter sp. NIBR2454]|uniref:hypothetical protein n=1 Tax=Caulobacter sp. NIBR2454 TaxID=3015996 RepID=UPI0022B65A5E|nr:hypothetical protein [Caulobacter sp. NIBR2454]